MTFELQTKYMDWDNASPALLMDTIEYQQRDQEIRRINALRATEQAVFESVGLIEERDYDFHDVDLSLGEWVHTVRIKPTNAYARQVYYMTHGFGGTSLFYYELASKLRVYGQVILFDLRGMGFSSKKCPPLTHHHQIIAYFVGTIQQVQSHYCHKSITLIAHSFGSYVSMLYSSRHPQVVKRQIVFSPIGITPKQEDYKSKIRSFSDLGNYIISEIGWKFELTYKTLLKYFACCCKKAVLKSSFRKYGGTELMVENMAEIVLRLYDEPLCSERLFFKIFEPRVLPIYNLLDHYDRLPCVTPTIMVYGQDDWVDKSGAQALARDHPDIFQLFDLKGVSHQIFFECRQNLEEEILAIIKGK